MRHSAFPRFKKLLIVCLIIIVLLAGVVFAIRLYNQNKYQSAYSLASPTYYKSPSDLSLYPTELEGVTVTHVDQKAAQGFHFVPKELKHKGVIVVFGGSEGTPGYDQAKIFAQNGYEVFSMFMFGQPNQPKTLTKIPLEQFEDILSVINTEAVSETPITVFGASKGAEYALNLAAKYSEIDHLILVSPAAYTFAGLDFSQYASSWTWNGNELPYIDLKRSSLPIFLSGMVVPQVINSPVRYKGIYTSAINTDQNKEDKHIPVKETTAQILLIAGQEDQMWDSPSMAALIQKERPENTTLQIYEDAGHVFIGNGVMTSGNMLLRVGGTEEGNKKAQEESNRLMLKKLSQWHH